MEKLSLPYEVWRAVKGYEGLYQVSNLGRVKSLERVDRLGRVKEERIMKLQKTRYGYLRVLLCKNGKAKRYSVHRLVAQAFLNNPDNLPVVNHKDEVKTNNFVFIQEDGSVDFNKSNLEWCDDEYSINYGTRTERMAKTKSKTVYQYTLDGTFVREWPSVQEVQRQTGWRASHLSECCRGKIRHAYGYVWSYTKKAESA